MPLNAHWRTNVELGGDGNEEQVFKRNKAGSKSANRTQVHGSHAKPRMRSMRTVRSVDNKTSVDY